MYFVSGAAARMANPPGSRYIIRGQQQQKPNQGYVEIETMHVAHG